MVKSKDVSVSLTTKGDISPQPHIDEDRPSTSVDECKDEPKKNGSRSDKKRSVEDGDDTYVPPEVPDPFRFRINLTPADKIKVALMTIFVLPIRVFLVTFFLFLTWLGCFVGLLGYSEQELESKPIQGWRRKWWHPMFAAVMRQMFIWGGLKWEFKGRKASRDEAPLLVIGPHSSFMDGVIVLLSGGKAPCTKIDSKHIPLLGTILRFIQPVFVKRSSKESRQTTLTEIKNRATSKEPWSQIVIFPEGTCSNGSVLIKFKQGAFSAGVPIQPVLLRYPNRLNTLTWTWDGPSALKTMWLTTCQWSTKMVIEYLPVYRPSEAERQDPTLYAENVRQLMAAALGIGTTEFSYDDLRFLNTGDPRQSQHTLAIVKLLKFRAKNGLKPEQLPSEIERISNLIEQKAANDSGAVEATQADILAALGLESSEAAREMFTILNMVKDNNQDESADQNSGELVDPRVFLAALYLINMDGQSAFKALCSDGEETPSQSAFCRLCWLVMQIPAEHSRALYHHLKPNLTSQTFKEYLINHHDRCKGVVYFDCGRMLAVEPEPGSDSTTDQSVKRQKAE